MSTFTQDTYSRSAPVVAESTASAVSWAAIFAGTFASVALAIVLTTLAAGVGLTTISAWPNAGASITTFSIATGIGLIVVQWLTSAFGGFITGRLRTKWAGLHTHEVFFRDTAHGFLAWALATVIGTAVATSALTSVVGGGVHAASNVAASAASGAAQSAGVNVNSYTVDSLFRSDHPTSDQDATAQATRILANGLRTGDVPADDKAYLSRLVAARTGISQDDAQQRVDTAIAATKDAAVKARSAADAARKATATFAIFTALSLMIGAFIASAAAAYGGSLRDEY
jgi:hypothetical protein